jgi:hypothetical protein
VYGTIIPYAYDGVHKGEAKHWQRHREAVKAVTDDCRRLRSEFPKHLLILAGDFNMNLDGTRWYGLAEVKKAICEELDQLGMKCCTLQDIRTDTVPRANVDHIWVSSFASQLGETEAWFGDFSDHNGMRVQLTA